VLIASMVKLAGTSQRDKASDPSSVLSGMNAALFGNTQNQLLTAAYVHLDSESRVAVLGGGASANASAPRREGDRGRGKRLDAGGIRLYYLFERCSAAAVGGSVAALHRWTCGGGERLGRILWAGGAGNATTADRRGCAHRCCGPDYFYCAAVGASQDDDLTVLACDYIGVDLVAAN
jgi:hypothetical protein